MFRFFIAASICLLVSATVSAQEPPRVEVFGGYAFVTRGGRQHLNGWVGSASVNLNSWLGLEGEACGAYDHEEGSRLLAPNPHLNGAVKTLYFESTTRVHTVTGGPRFTLRRHGFDIYGHALVGYGRDYGRFVQAYTVTPTPGPRLMGGGRESGVAFVAGGGVDVRLGDRVSLRAFQVDYLGVNRTSPYDLGTRSTLRITTGLVYNFGRK